MLRFWLIVAAVLGVVMGLSAWSLGAVVPARCLMRSRVAMAVIDILSLALFFGLIRWHDGISETWLRTGVILFSMYWMMKLVLLVLVGAWLLIGRLGNKSGEAQTQFVTDAVHNAALTCYAVEGAYPTELSYLRENYGLAYDESHYRVTYSTFASNVVPDIYVVELGADR